MLDLYSEGGRRMKCPYNCKWPNQVKGCPVHWPVKEEEE